MKDTRENNAKGSAGLRLLATVEQGLKEAWVALQNNGPVPQVANSLAGTLVKQAAVLPSATFKNGLLVIPFCCS